MSVTTAQIAWLAGWLEGEGSFIYRHTPCISADSTDHDVLASVAGLLGATVHERKRLAPHGRKRIWQMYVGSKRAAGWMMTIYPLMGLRRRAAIRYVLEQWQRRRGQHTESERARSRELWQAQPKTERQQIAAERWQRRLKSGWKRKPKRDPEPECKSHHP